MIDTTPHLRPATLGDLLDAAFRFYRIYFEILIGIAAVLLIPLLIVQVIFRSLIGNYVYVTWVLVMLGLIIPCGAIVNAIVKDLLKWPTSLFDAYRLDLHRYVALILAFIAEVVILLIPVALAYGCLLWLDRWNESIPKYGSADSDPEVLMAWLVFLFILIYPFIFCWLISNFLLVTQVIVIEGRGPIAGLRRSFRLVASSFGRIFVSTLLLVLLYIIGQVPAILLGFPVQLMSLGTLTVSQLGLIVVLPLQSIVSTILYYDCRERHEATNQGV